MISRHNPIRDVTGLEDYPRSMINSSSMHVGGSGSEMRAISVTRHRGLCTVLDVDVESLIRERIANVFNGAPRLRAVRYPRWSRVRFASCG